MTRPPGAIDRGRSHTTLRHRGSGSQPVDRPRESPRARLYEAERDEANSEIQDFLTQAKVQQNVLGLLRDSILPRTRDTLELAMTDYKANNVDISAVLSAQREVLQVEIQAVQVESELAKALASLERAVGCQVNQRTLEPAPGTAEDRATASSPPAAASGPFRRRAVPAPP